MHFFEKSELNLKLRFCSHKCLMKNLDTLIEIRYSLGNEKQKHVLSSSLYSLSSIIKTRWGHDKKKIIINKENTGQYHLIVKHVP